MCAVRVTLCVSGIVRAVHQSSSKLGDTPLVRLDLFESLPSRRFGCRASTTNSTTKSRSTSLYNARSSSRARCRALQLYSAPERSTSLQLYSALHSTSSHPPSVKSLCGGGVPSSHPSLGLSVFFLSFPPSREDLHLTAPAGEVGCVAATCKPHPTDGQAWGASPACSR